MIKSTVKVGQKRKSAGTNVTPVGTTQLLEEDYLDVRTDTPSHADRFVYPEPTERSIDDGMIVEVDGNDMTQYNPGGWWMDNISDPARLTPEIVPSKEDKDAKVHMVVVCVTGVDHLNVLSKWLLVERKWDNAVFDTEKRKKKGGITTKVQIRIGKYVIKPTGNVNVRDVQYVHRSKFPEYKGYRGFGLSVYSDAILRMGIAKGSNVDWASVYSDGVKWCMIDRQRGIGMNPPRGMVDVYNNPSGHDEHRDDDMTRRASRIEAVRMYTSCLQWLFGDADRVPAIYGATDCFVSYDEEKHGSIPRGHYVVEIPSTSCLRHMCVQYTNNDRAVVLDHNTVCIWPDDGYVTKTNIRLVVLLMHSRRVQWGPRLRLAMNKYLAYVDEIERSGDISKPCAKTMVNHLVGSWAAITHCTSMVKTTTASDHSYLKALLFTARQVGSSNVNISRHHGMEYMFNPEGTEYDYYKLRTVSTAPKSTTFHMLYLAVTLRTECEMIKMMKLLPGPKCPLSQVIKWLIAVHVDCVEYYRDIHTLSDYAYRIPR